MNIKTFINWLKNYRKHKKIIIVIVMVILAIPIGMWTAKEIEHQRQINYPSPTIEVLSSQEHLGGVEEYTLEFKVTNADSATVEENEVVIIDDLVTTVVPLKQKSNKITIIAKNKYKRGYETIVITRDETEAEKQARLEREQAKLEAEAEKVAKRKQILTDAKKIQSSSEFKVFEKAIGNRVTYDFDDVSQYHYTVAKKDQRVLYIKANTSKPFTLYAWTADENGGIEHKSMYKEYNYRKYYDYLREQEGYYNNFDYEDWIKFVWWTFIPEDQVNKTWFISEDYPWTIEQIPEIEILAKIN